MIKVSVFYPQSAGSKFDMDYYVGKHLPMVARLTGDACKGTAAEQGLGGGAPGEPPEFAAMGHLYFESVEAFQQAFAPHAAEIMGDVPNYTDIQPKIQISEVKVSNSP